MCNVCMNMSFTLCTVIAQVNHTPAIGVGKDSRHSPGLAEL